MSSNFFQLAQNIINDLVDCLPLDYDSSNELGSINIERLSDLQRLSEKNLQSNDNISYKKRYKENNPSDGSDDEFTSQSNSNLSNVSNNTCQDVLPQNTEIQEICEIGITTPGWLQHAKSEFRETQNKRDALGLHVLAIARSQDSLTQNVTNTQGTGQNINLITSRRMIISSDNSVDNIQVQQNNVKTINVTPISKWEDQLSSELSTNNDDGGKTSPLFSGGSDGSLPFVDSLTFEGKSSINTGGKSFLSRPIGGKVRSALKMYYKYFLSKNGNDEEESISMDSLSDQHKDFGDVSNFMQATNHDEYETECEEEEVILTSQQDLSDQHKDSGDVDRFMQETNRDEYETECEEEEVIMTSQQVLFQQQHEDFDNNFTCARRSYKNNPNENDEIQLEYETECEEEEVILTSQQKLFQQTTRIYIKQQHEFFNNNSTCASSSHKNNPNDNNKYLNFMNNSPSNNRNREGLIDTCDYFEEEWDTMLIGQTAAS
ncbi:5617_t:CDS:2 [Funneliformis mosseae]|uniref:5617_t:CDS:1 n=1 Tax=Funneliformis mosseae TaxID=27381 RepID=A0A9N9GL07_FUNMO|nr:5617_t:CDS:2 [Funneliformis mosseae]